VRNLRPGKKPVAGALLAAAVKEGASLLVMGGYGHSRTRTREFIFGGVTREILKDAPLPVFVLH
jgi:nucleotide-binding universal stress UspA family protein